MPVKTTVTTPAHSAPTLVGMSRQQSIPWAAQKPLFQRLRTLQRRPHHHAEELADLRNRLAEINLPLIAFVMERIGTSDDDAYSDGMIALVRSIDKFDVGRGFTFSTYACRAIFKSVNAAKTRHSIREARTPLVLDARKDGETDWREPAQDRRQDARESLVLADALELLDSDAVSAQERQAIRQSVLERRTLLDIGRSLGVTKERARQLRNRGLRKLRIALAG